MKPKYFILGALSFTILILNFFSLQKAYARTITVGTNGEEFSSIQEAINNTNSSDSVFISSGIYQENIIIDNKENLEIIGEDPKTVILKSTDKSNGTGIRITKSSNIKILNMTIRDFLYGIYGGDENFKIEKLLVHNIHFKENGDIDLPSNCYSTNPYKNCSNWNEEGASIRLRNIKNSKIQNNIIEKGERGILIFNNESNANNEISFNQIYENQQYGLRLNNGGSNNKILNNIIYKNKGEGIEIYRTDSTNDKNLIIAYNQIFQNTNDGIRVERQEDAIIKFNNIYQNANSNKTAYSPGTDPIYGGLYIKNTINSDVNNNIFDNNNLYSFYLDTNAGNLNIYKNSIINHSNSPQAYDDGNFNNLELNNKGNFWSDLTENSYNLAGNADNRDNSPLSVAPGENIEARITLNISKYSPQIVELNWNSLSLDEFSQYVIYIRDNNETIVLDRNKFSQLKNAQNTKLQLTNLETNHDYTAYMEITDSNNSRILVSPEIEFTTLRRGDIPTTPQGINLSSIDRGKIFLSWFPNPIIENVSYYEIYKKSNEEEDFTYLKKVFAPSTFLYDSGLNSYQIYSYKIKAKNNKGSSPFSLEKNIQAENTLDLNPDRNINSFNGLEFDTNKIISKTSDQKSELVFSPSLAENMSPNQMTIVGINTIYPSSKFPVFNNKYSHISDQIYYYSLSDNKNNSELNNLTEPALISIKYSNDEIQNKNENALSITYFDPVKQTWIPLLSEINPNSNVITARTRFLGIFKILYRSIPLNLTDINTTDWVYGYVQNLSRSDIISGFSDNTFRPHNFATRAEVIKMSLKTEAYKIPFFVFENPCPDINKEEWFAPYFKFALGIGLINGYSDNTCKANNFITRAEALKIIIGEKAKDYNDYLDFSDIENIPDWSKSYIRYALDHGIISGYSDNTFRATEPILRQELAKILYESYRVN